MLEFFYKSLDTLQETKKPSKEEVIKMTIMVLVVIIISAILFSIVDFIFLKFHKDILYPFFTNLFK